MNYLHADLPTKHNDYTVASDASGNCADFPIDVLPLYSRAIDTGVENELDARHARVVVRTDTNEHLGIVGPRTMPIPYARTMEATDYVLNDAGLRYTSNTKVFDNGSTMRRQITFPNITIEPVVGDVVCFQIDHFDSYNGKWALQLNASGQRLVCLNGMTQPDYYVRAYTRHTTNAVLNVHELADQLREGIDNFKESNDKYQRYYKEPCNYDQFARLMLKTIAYNKEHEYDDKRPAISKMRMEQLNECWDSNTATLGHNCWAAYNAMTEWATHAKTRGQSHMMERKRNAEVAKVLRHPMWKDMVNESTNLRVI